MKPVWLESYLDDLARELRVRGILQTRMVDESRDHLLDAVEQARQEGLTPDSAQRRALERFGSARLVAAQLAAERNHVDKALLVVAVALGLTFCYYTSRPTFDDAGVACFGMLLCSGLLGLLGPRFPWLWALVVGAGTLLGGAISSATPDPRSRPLPLPWGLTGNHTAEAIVGSMLIMSFPLVGAYGGMVCRRIFNASVSSAN